jgi:hypothetical protein
MERYNCIIKSFIICTLHQITGACICAMDFIYIMLVEKWRQKKLLGRPLKELQHKGVDKIKLAQAKVEWWALVDLEINLWLL